MKIGSPPKNKITKIKIHIILGPPLEPQHPVKRPLKHPNVLCF